MASSRSSRITTAALMLGAAGCTDEPTITCSDMEAPAYTHTYEADDFPYGNGVPSIDLHFTDGDPRGTRTLDVVFASAPVTDGDRLICPLLADDVTASFETITAVPGERGGWQCHPGGMLECARNTLTMTIPPELRDPDASISVTDPSGTRSLPIADALVERTFTPVGISDWTFHHNQIVTFRYTPAADLVTLTENLLGYLVRPDGTTIPIPGGGCAVSGPGAITCTIPSGDTGEGLFGFDLAGRIDHPAVGISVRRSVLHAAKIAP